MPSISYMNQSAPFWDFVASLEQRGLQHPRSAQNSNDSTGQENDQSDNHEEYHGPPAFSPWGWGQFFGDTGGMPFRGPPPHHGEGVPNNNKEKEATADSETREHNDNGEGPSGCSGSDNEGRPHGRGRHGRCGGRRDRCGPGGPGGFGGRGNFGGPCGRGGFGSRHGPHHHGPPHHGPRGGLGGRGPWGRGGFGRGFDPSALIAQFMSQFNDNNANDKNDDSEDYSPEADIFDTEGAFVVHVSVPGAKKEDVGVNWDAEKSELSVAGVIYRPGDEEFLKTLAMNERKVGPFDKKIRLGTRANPAHIDVDGITAKLEDGVLRVEVPKLDAGYVDVKKVDIE